MSHVDLVVRDVLSEYSCSWVVQLVNVVLKPERMQCFPEPQHAIDDISQTKDYYKNHETLLRVTCFIKTIVAVVLYPIFFIIQLLKMPNRKTNPVICVRKDLEASA